MDWKTTSTVLENLRDYNNTSAWNGFVDHFRPLILRFALRLGVSNSEAEDAAQEVLITFANAYRDGRYQRERGRLKDWLFGIARMTILNLRKTKAARAGVVHYKNDPDSESSDGAAMEPAAVEDHWEKEWETHVYEQCLLQIRNEVEPKTYEIFTLRLEGVSPEEIMSKLSISRSTVDSANYRAAKRIRELATKYQEA